MGAFIHMVKAKDARVPDERRAEFVDGVLTIFRESGMFHVSPFAVDGSVVWTLEWPKVDEYGVCEVSYNWFENARWENAGIEDASLDARANPWAWAHAEPGFDPDVYSNKVGSGSFCDGIVAAYALEALFLDKPSAVFVDSFLPSTLEEYSHWISYLFPSENTTFLPDLWRVFEVLNNPDIVAVDCGDVNWHLWYEEHKHDTLSCFISAGEIISVLEGTRAWLLECEKPSEILEQGEELAAELFRAAAEDIVRFHDASGLSDEEQFEAFKMAWEFRCSRDDRTNFQNEEADGVLLAAVQSACALDAPAYVARLLSETYGRPFWEVWNGLPEKVRRRHSGVKTRPVTTADFFGLRNDDLIPWWTPERPLTWSEEMTSWFEKLKKRHEELTRRANHNAFTMDEVMELLKEINKKFWYVMCFGVFIEETLEDLKDPRIQACWQQISDMANVPDPKAAAYKAFPSLRFAFMDQYFHPASAPNTKLMRSYYSELGGKERLESVPLQRYLGLVGNKALRREVLGF